MANIVDRRQETGNKKFTTSRERFLKRNKKQIRKAIDKAIAGRGMLIFGQGSYRLHKYLQKIKYAADNDQAMSAVKNIGLAFVVDPVLAIGKAVASTLTAGRFGPSAAVSREMQKYINKINHLSSIFNAIAPQMATYMGGALKFEEEHSGTFADALGHLYMAASNVRKYEIDGQQQDQLPVAEWAIKRELHLASQALKAITRADNSPFKWYHPGRWSRPMQ